MGSTRAWASYSVLALLIGQVAGCAHTEEAAPKRGIVLECDIEQAHVFVDDYPLVRAQWSKTEILLRPGPHRVEVSADGYYPYYEEITVRERGFDRVSVRLVRRID